MGRLGKSCAMALAAPKASAVAAPMMAVTKRDMLAILLRLLSLVV
jgi:hypothetical protein